MVLLIDQDNVLADFEWGFYKKWEEEYPDEPVIHPSERTTFKIYNQYQARLKDKIKEVITSPGFIKNLKPIPGSIEAVQQLHASCHQVYICSSLLSENDNSAKEKVQWIKTYLGEEFIDVTVFADDKTLIRGDILIDDRPSVNGIYKPEWEHIIFDRPFNRHVSNKRRISWDNWRKVLDV